MMEILDPSDPSDTIEQPVVLLNYHMGGVDAMPTPVRDWEVVYHLRLLSVQYLAVTEEGYESEGLSEKEIERRFLEARGGNEEVRNSESLSKELRKRVPSQ